MKRGLAKNAERGLDESKNSLSNKGYSGTGKSVGESKCSPILRPVHRFFFPLVTEGKYCCIIMHWQMICGIRDGKRDGSFYNLVLHGFFSLASMLGEEIYYLFPALVWLAFPLALNFTTHMGLIPPLGQLVKDIMHLPRPPSFFKYMSASAGEEVQGKIAKLETHFGTEYGLPSTHAMSGSLVFSVMYALLKFRACDDDIGDGLGDGEIVIIGLPLRWALVAIFVTISACMSRLYMGVHSVADLITGLAISAGAQWLLIGRGWESYINAWIYESSSGPLVPFLSILAFLRFYPSTTPWSASFATASELFGLWAGLCVSYWASINLFPEAGNALMAQSLVRDTCSSIVPIAMSWSQRILRVSSGMVMVFVTRIVTKKISTNLMLWLLRLGITSVSKEQAVDSEGMSVLLEHAYVVEPPRRILGLLLTTAMCVLGAPWIWNQMGI